MDFTWLTRYWFVLRCVVKILGDVMLVLNSCIATQWGHILNVSVWWSRYLNPVCLCLTSTNYTKSRFVVKLPTGMGICFLYANLVLLDLIATLFHTLVLMRNRNGALAFRLLVDSLHFLSWFMQIQHWNCLIVKGGRGSRCQDFLSTTIGNVLVVISLQIINNTFVFALVSLIFMIGNLNHFSRRTFSLKL